MGTITLYHVTIFDTYGRGAFFLSGTMVDTFVGDFPKETTGVANAVGKTSSWEQVFPGGAQCCGGPSFLFSWEILLSLPLRP